MKQDFEEFTKKKNQIFKSFQNNDYSTCKSFIEEQLSITKQVEANWNKGNSLHICYTYLGLIAIEENKIEEAKEFLLLSGEISGSPQLKSFGPNMLLAKKLLELGANEEVILYLKKCSKFWYLIFSFWKLRKWKSKIKSGKIPDFGANLRMYLGYQEEIRV